MVCIKYLLYLLNNNLKTDIMSTTEKTLQAFTKEVNPLNGNCICIFEQRAVRKHLLFQVDKANFESDNEFLNAVDFIIDSLNKNL